MAAVAFLLIVSWPARLVKLKLARFSMVLFEPTSLGFGPVAPEMIGKEAKSYFSRSVSSCSSGSGVQSSTSSSISCIAGRGLPGFGHNSPTHLFRKLDEMFPRVLCSRSGLQQGPHREREEYNF